MKTLLLAILIISGSLFILSVIFISPKGGLTLGMFSASKVGGNEFGSKKSLESKLKIIATISAIVFLFSVYALSYIK